MIGCRLCDGRLVCFLDVAERHSKFDEKLAAFIVCRRGGYEDKVKADLAFDLIELDFWEDRLIGNTTCVISTAIKGLGGNTTEVADVWSSDVDEAMEKLPHALATKGNAGTEGFTFTKLEVRNSFLRVSDGWFLASDLGDLNDGIVNGYLAIGSFAHAGGDDDFFKPWDLMRIAVTELLCKSWNNLVFVVLL